MHLDVLTYLKLNMLQFVPNSFQHSLSQLMTIPPTQFLKIENELFKHENASVFAFPNPIDGKVYYLIFFSNTVFFFTVILPRLKSDTHIFPGLLK